MYRPCLALLLALVLQAPDLRAELMFRSVEQVNGQERWSPIRKYSSPSDVARARSSAAGEDVRVFLSGLITREDVEGANVMAGLLASGRQKLLGNTVWLSSNGGDIDAGMDLARLLRKLGVYTVVGKNDQCMSACVFAFMGGERRVVAGRLGIHRPFFPFTQDVPDRQARFRHLQRVVRSFVDEMDFPPSLYEAVMIVPPQTMHVLDAAELKKYYLQGISPSSEDLADAAAARRLGVTMAEYLKRKERAPACAFPVPGQDRCDARTLEAAASGGATDIPGRVQPNDTASSGREQRRATGNAQGTGTPRVTPRSPTGPT